MKTAISIDDALLQEADQTARLIGLSRLPAGIKAKVRPVLKDRW
jgi:hypothetical protein